MSVTATSASALLGVLPALLFFLIFQRTLTRGIAAGALK
jgi:raffinose/stachyose/melibiose transport system permease protein